MRSLFFLCRHGETFLNIQGNYRGWSNGPDAQLNPDGIESANNAAKYLLSLNQVFSRIITSPLDRTQMTGAIIAEYFGITKIEIDDRLMPLNVGDLAGKPKKENPITPYLKNPNKKFPGGESVNEFEARQGSFGDYLLSEVANTGDSEILVVAHVSNCMFWWNLQNNKHDEEYLDESSDIILPGGIALVTEQATVPIFKENLNAQPPVEEDKINQYAAGYIPARDVPRKGTRCGDCYKFIQSGACVEVKGPIKAEQTCIQFVQGKPFVDNPNLNIVQLDPEVVGLGKGDTHCETCEYFGGYDRCRRVKSFDGNENKEKIEPGGCCNSFEPK